MITAIIQIRLNSSRLKRKALLKIQNLTLIEHLFSQLQEACAYFQDRNGHVSRWYFENKWKPSGPCPPPGAGRQELLDALIANGKVEVFEVSVNGRSVLALRPKREA